MSEADRLWREAMEEAAGLCDKRELFQLLHGDIQSGATAGLLADDIRDLPRPAGWGEGGKGDE